MMNYRDGCLHRTYRFLNSIYLIFCSSHICILFCLRWRLDNLGEDTNYECLVQVTNINFYLDVVKKHLT